MGPWLFLLFLAIASDTVASGIGGFLLWQHRRNNGASSFATFAAILLFAICFEGLMLFAANAYGFHVRPERTLGYAVCFWAGRSARSIALWLFVLALLSKRPHKSLD